MLISTILALTGSVLLCVGCVYGACPQGMIQGETLCYKWYDTSVSVQAATGICRDNGGVLAGRGSDFIRIMQENHELAEYIPKEYCFWIMGVTPLRKLGIYNWYREAKPRAFSVLLDHFLFKFYDIEMCYKGNRWEQYFITNEKNNYFVCQYAVSLFRKVSRLPDLKITDVWRKVQSGVIRVTPLFVEDAPISTMCSRLCQKFNGCSVFNYNKEFKECRGFEKTDGNGIDHHDDWEVWTTD